MRSVLDVHDVKGPNLVIRVGGDGEDADRAAREWPGPPPGGRSAGAPRPSFAKHLTGPERSAAPSLALGDAAAVASFLRGAVDFSVGLTATSVVSVVHHRRVNLAEMVDRGPSP